MEIPKKMLPKLENSEKVLLDADISQLPKKDKVCKECITFLGSQQV
jgi:hypothetical protein